MQRGKGRDLLFLHGYLSSKEAFSGQMAYFARSYRVTALDFPGFGGAERLTSPYDVRDYAAWTGEAIAALGLQRPFIVAHSFGGRVAIKGIAHGLVPCAGLVLAGSAGIVEKRGLSYRCKVGAYRLVKRFAPQYAEAHFGSREYRTLSPVMKESYKKIVNEDLRQDAALLRVPTLLVYGERDTATPKGVSSVLHASIPDSRLVYLKDCGHFVFLDGMVAFNLVTEEFLGAI